MNKLYTLFTSLLFSAALSAQTFCDVQGNVVIYSNYDGGTLNINVDQNIPNLKIGIVSYEPVHVTLSGTYVGNVTEVRFAGYSPSGNNHCGLGNSAVTTISGVPNPVDTIIYMPTSTYANPNGYGVIICNTSCVTTTNQGGCNTADQVSHYFLTNFGGSLYFHFTQYGCWSNTMNISAGGNCCANPLLGVEETTTDLFSLAPNPATGIVTMLLPFSGEEHTLQITNVLGETVREIRIAALTTSQDISLEGLAPGTYFFRMQSGENSTTEKLIISE
jgi:hypothetical protein